MVNFSYFECYMSHSTCYRQTSKMNIKGVLWHSTGANNPWLKRYVQPYVGDADYEKKLAKLGRNEYGNDWNHQYVEAGLNCWIGKFADGSVGTVKTMPWDFRPWGCGGGSKGSCNDGWIQFEICEDSLNDKAYAQKVWDEAVRLTAWLCEKFNLDPTGTVQHNGVTVPVILCHHDSYNLGLGSGHVDIDHWFPKILGKNMSDARKEVKALMGSQPQPQPQPTTLYKVQVGAFTKKANADAFAKELESKGFDTYVKKVGRYYKVQCGAFSDKKNAEALLNKLHKAGYTDAFITTQ